MRGKEREKTRMRRKKTMEQKKTIKLCIRTRYSKRQTKWSNSKICTEVKITENEPPLGLCCTCSKYVVQATFNSLFLFFFSLIVLAFLLIFFAELWVLAKSSRKTGGEREKVSRILNRKRSNNALEMKLISFSWLIFYAMRANDSRW